MTTSGTVDFNPDILDIIEDAHEMVGIEARTGYDLKTARRSLDMLMREWGNRGINMWTLKQEVLPATMGSNEILLPVDTIDVLDCAWRTGSGQEQSDKIVNRYSIAQWTSLGNKGQMGLPSQFYVHRIAPNPILYLWPVPSEAGSIVIWKLRSMEDVGRYPNTPDIVTRFLPAMVAGLAYYIALKNPSAAERVPMLQAEYDRQFTYAAEEDRDRASFFLTPDLSAYSR